MSRLVKVTKDLPIPIFEIFAPFPGTNPSPSDRNPILPGQKQANRSPFVYPFKTLQ